MLPSKCLVAVTGGAASGKSEFCRLLEQSGLPVWQADNMAAQVLAAQRTKPLLEAAFGKNVWHNGQPDRTFLRDVVFAKAQKRRELEEIIHPGVFLLINEIIAGDPRPVLVFEIPLLFELNLTACFDYVISVVSPLVLRRERLHKRGLEEATVAGLLASQTTDETKISGSDTVIYNDRGLPELQAAAQRIAKQLIDYPVQRSGGRKPLPTAGSSS